MRADNCRHVVAAARQRAEQTRERAIAALRRMDATGQRITFEALAHQAGVSRSWLYTQDDLRAEIERLRRRASSTSSTPAPERQRASDTSLLRRLEAATARIHALEADNQQLRGALARALGERRAADVLGQTRRETTRRNRSTPTERSTPPIPPTTPSISDQPRPTA